MNRSVWSVTFDPVEAGGPYSIEVSSRHCRKSISDVLFGDVWLCSGQSNMELQLRKVSVSVYREGMNVCHINRYFKTEVSIAAQCFSEMQV